MLTINAMTTANTVLVPIQCEYYALEGLSQLIHTINLVQKRLNPDLEMEGVVFTMYDARTNLSLQVVDNVKTNLDTNIYKTIIPSDGNKQRFSISVLHILSRIVHFPIMSSYTVLSISSLSRPSPLVVFP